MVGGYPIVWFRLILFALLKTRNCVHFAVVALVVVVVVVIGSGGVWS